MKHSRITIQNDHGQFATALNKADRHLRENIKKLKKEGEISFTMMAVRIKLAMIAGGFAMELNEINIESNGGFNGIAMFMVHCKGFPAELYVSIDLAE